jgi:hypothetical protein
MIKPTSFGRSDVSGPGGSSVLLEQAMQPVAAISVTAMSDDRPGGATPLLTTMEWWPPRRCRGKRTS